MQIGRVALPFVLLATGAVVFYVSPWPAIVRLYVSGAHVTVVPRWATVVPPLVVVTTWGLAIWLSLQVRRD